MKLIHLMLNIIEVISLRINEEFLSFQGEINVGRLAYFIRLGGCPLQCNFCDTDYAHTEFFEMDIKELANKAIYFPRLVITGGEPLYQKEELAKFINRVTKMNENINIEIETNGTIKPSGIKCYDKITFNVSPKMKNSGNKTEDRLKPEVIEWFKDYGANFKFVVDTKEDINEVNAFVTSFEIKKHNVYLMPLGKTTKEQLSKMATIAEYAKVFGYNITPRLHVLIWGEERAK